jgi:hypothetical protein
MDHGKTARAKRKSGRKSTLIERLPYVEKDFLEKSQNYCSTGDNSSEYS